MDIFLDMTGTITDMESENYAIYKLAQRIKEKFGIDMSAEEVLRRIEEYRKPIMDKRHEIYIPIRNLVVEGVERILSRKVSDSERKWLMEEYVNVHATHVKLGRNSLEGLKKLRGMAKHLGMITDADLPYTKEVIKSLQISQFFDSVITAEEVGVGKPNPRIFEEAIKRGRGKIKIYIGDSERRDMWGAKQVRMIAIKIGKKTKYGDFSAHDLLEASEIIEKHIRINPPR